jgi:hypothetical protein
MVAKLTNMTVHTVPATSYAVLTRVGGVGSFVLWPLAALRSVGPETVGRTRGRTVERVRRATVVMKPPRRKVR